MKSENKDFVAVIRMTYTEKNKIAQRAKKTGKNFSQFIRDSALGCEIKEKPDRKIFLDYTKAMRNMEISIRNLSREANRLGFIDERKLKRDREDWNNLIIEMKQKFL